MSSLWIETTKNELNLKSMEKDEETEVCVIGAGLFGLTTAYYLTLLGKKVTVVDKGEIGEKVSGNTTGKITSQHALFYYHLIKDYGEEYARKYLEANEEAIKNIKDIIDKEQIECEYTERKAYVYTTKQDEVIDIEREVDAVKKIGKDARLVTETELPFKVKAAIEFDGQAQFHPIKYMLGLAKSIIKDNKIYNFTTVIDVKKEGETFNVYTDRGIINAKQVVLATHYPIINAPGFHFLKMYQSTSYIIAIQTNSKLPQGMYINDKPPIYSFRTAPYNGKDILLIGGSDHKTGEPVPDNSKYEELEKKAKELYPDCKVLFRWNTRDCISLDKIPYIGELSNLMKNMYIGTGFKKWGMTFSNIAAKIITDMIMGKENKYSNIFHSTRMNPIKNRWEVKNILKESVESLALNKFKIETHSIDEIKNDNGGIIKIDDENVGIYKDKEGKIYAVKPVCTHLGCLLSWNNLDKTWDCPCHGSRFDYMGKNIYEPAIKNLTTINIQKNVN